MISSLLQYVCLFFCLLTFALIVMKIVINLFVYYNSFFVTSPFEILLSNWHMRSSFTRINLLKFTFSNIQWHHQKKDEQMPRSLIISELNIKMVIMQAISLKWSFLLFNSNFCTANMEICWHEEIRDLEWSTWSSFHL